MNALEPLSAESRSRKPGPGLLRPGPENLPAKVSPSGVVKPHSWTISPDPIQLEYADDSVSWDLKELQKVYATPGTVFEIEFISTPGPRPLRAALGPFKTLGANVAGDAIVGEKVVYDVGRYTYNLYVTVPHMNRQKITIDPQIDNVAPPPPPNGRPPEAPDPEDRGRTEY